METARDPLATLTGPASRRDEGVHSATALLALAGKPPNNSTGRSNKTGKTGGVDDGSPNGEACDCARMATQ